MRRLQAVAHAEDWFVVTWTSRQLSGNVVCGCFAERPQPPESAIRAIQIDQTYQPAMQFLRQLQMESGGQ